MTKVLRHPARIGLLLALFVGLIGSQGDGGCRQTAMKAWADLQAQLDAHQDQLDAQHEQICALNNELFLLTGDFLIDDCAPDKCADSPDAPGCGGGVGDGNGGCEGEDCR